MDAIQNNADCQTDLHTQLADAGVALMERGFPIIACDGKIPLGGKNWHKHPPNEQLLRFQLSNAKLPAIGLLLGPDSGIVDIEADSPEEEKLVAELFEGCEPAITPTYSSTRGKHRFYKWDDRLNETGKAVINYSNGNGSKLGIRIGADGKGAQSVIPPSHGREWTVSLDDCDLAQLPESVVDLLLAAVKPKRTTTAKHTGKGIHTKALKAMLRLTIEDGNDGSMRLFTAACRAVELDLSDDEALATIREYERKKPFPKPWTDAEIIQRVRDAEEKVERGAAVTIANYEKIEVTNEDGSKQEIKVPLSMTEIIEEINQHTGGWPRRVDNVLFVDDPFHGLDWFDRRTTAGLFGWLRRRCKIDWTRGGAFVGQAELFAELERTSRKYEAIELLPHEPPVASVYYRGDVPKPGDGTHLAWLLDRFRPDTRIDRDLIQAAFMTVFWGGPVSCRPAFVITSDQGRGAGKTKLAEIIAYLAGGFVDVSAGEDIGTLKQRFLSPEGQTKRVAILDNVKSLKLSWAELEALITTPIISGKRMYIGEGQRPNLITWLITLNGVSLATDMSQRSVIIKLVKGENAGGWYEETIQYINEHREAIIEDIIGTLREERCEPSAYTRWASWERDILSRLPEPEEAQLVILERQEAANTEADEAEIIEDFFASQLHRLDYLPHKVQVRIPTAVAARWYGWAVNEKVKTAAASKRLHQMADEKQLKRISVDTSRTYGRGFVWTGTLADIVKDPILNDLNERMAAKEEATTHDA